jgi:predicted RNA binding protein YcfA (HicA-like mRNA interferase family)
MNERLPALSAKDVIRALERAGFVKSRMSGSHCRMVHPGDPTRKITVPIHAKDLKRGTLHSIIAQSGLTMAEFLALL